eukprot:m.242773 g.242773  ORF g.242773 m.242773 type:complete len:384 (+) comp26344_c1_seq1:214-1365(+)
MSGLVLAAAAAAAGPKDEYITTVGETGSAYIQIEGTMTAAERAAAASSGGGGGGPAAAAAARPRPPWGQPVYTESRTSSRAALTLELRRAVYADSLTHRPVPLGKYKPRDLSPAAFDPVHGGLRRVLPWLKRELFVLCGANQEHLDFLLQLVCALLRRAGLENRAPLQAELEPFFMRNTERFLSELTSFAMSPFDMVCYDQLVTYSRGPRRQRADHGAPSVVAGKRAAPTSHERDSRRTKRRFDRNDESRRRTTRLCAAAAVGSSGLRAAMLAVDPLVQPSSLDITRPSAVGDGPDRRSSTGTTRSKDEGQPGRAAHTARTAPPSTHCRNDQSTQRAEQQVGRGQSVQRTEEELQCRLKVVNHRLALARKRLETLRADKKRAS